MNKSDGRYTSFFEMSVGEINETYAQFKERFVLSCSHKDSLMLKVYKDMFGSVEAQAYAVAFLMNCWGIIPNKLLQKLIGNAVHKMPESMYYGRVHWIMVKYLNFNSKRVDELLEGVI